MFQAKIAVRKQDVVKPSYGDKSCFLSLQSTQVKNNNKSWAQHSAFLDKPRGISWPTVLQPVQVKHPGQALTSSTHVPHPLSYDGLLYQLHHPRQLHPQPQHQLASCRMPRWRLPFWRSSLSLLGYLAAPAIDRGMRVRVLSALGQDASLVKS